MKYSSLIIKQKNDVDERKITALASVEKVDRDKDIIYLDGMDIKEYKKNPVILWGHNPSQLPIGKASNIKIENKQLKMDIEFATMEENSLADSVYRLIKGGYLNCLSIGFSPDHDNLKWNEKRGGYDIYKSSLLEVSIVNIPSNTGAFIIQRSITKAFDDNVIDEIEKNELEMSLKTLENDNTESNFTEEKTEQNIENETIDEVQQLKDKIVDLELKVSKLEKLVVKDTTDDEEDPFAWIFSEDHDQDESNDLSDKDLNDELFDLINEVINQKQ